jgi:hypothetical protein
VYAIAVFVAVLLELPLNLTAIVPVLDAIEQNLAYYERSKLASNFVSFGVLSEHNIRIIERLQEHEEAY